MPEETKIFGVEIDNLSKKTVSVVDFTTVFIYDHEKKDYPFYIVLGDKTIKQLRELLVEIEESGITITISLVVIIRVAIEDKEVIVPELYGWASFSYMLIKKIQNQMPEGFTIRRRESIAEWHDGLCVVHQSAAPAIS